MKVEHLLEDEVEWELIYRKIGYDINDKLGDKQRLLRTSLRAIAKGAEETEGELCEGVDLEKEFETVETKLNSIEESLKERGHKAKEFGTFESRLQHIKRRVIALLKKEMLPETKEDALKALQCTDALVNQYFPKVTLPTRGGGITNTGNSDLIGFLQDQTHSEPDTSKGAIRKKSSKSSTLLQNSNPSLAEKTSLLAGMSDLGINPEGGGKAKAILSVLAKPIEKPSELEPNNSDNTSNQDEAEWIRIREKKLREMRIETENRIKKMENTDADVSSGEELEALVELQKAIQLKIELAKKKSRKPDQTDPVINRPNQGKGSQKQPVSKLSLSVDTETSESSEKSPPKRTKSRMKKKRDPSSDSERGMKVERWGFRYSSTGGLSLVEFLRRVERYKKTQHITDESLVENAFFLFEGVALDWYEDNHKQFRKWKHVVEGLRRAFVAEDNDYLVRQKCDNRKQQRHETFEVYMSQMNKLFQGLSYELSDEEKFNILKRNVKPAHRLGIALLKVKTLVELKDACRSLDSMDSSLYSLATDSPNQRQLQNRHQVFELEQSEPSEDVQTGNKKLKAKKKKNAESKKDSTSTNESRRTEEPAVCNVEQPNNFRQQNKNNLRSQNQYRTNQRDFSKGSYGGGRNKSRFNNFNTPNQTYVPIPMFQTPQIPSNPTPFLETWTAAVSGQNQNGLQAQQSNVTAGQGFPNVNAQLFAPQTQATTTRVQPVNQEQKMICWNCDGANHHQRFCMAPRRVFCWGCGYKDVYYDKCPNCSGNGAMRLSSGARQSQ